MSRPIFSFCYLNRSPQDIEEVRSTASLRTNTLSQRTQSQKVLLARKDQIQPSKIVLPPRLSCRPPIPSSQTPQPRLPPILTFSLGSLPDEPQVAEKPKLFDWKLFGNFCGVSARKESLSGCVCSVPCKNRMQWSKGGRTSDHTAYLALRNMPISPPNEVQIEKDIERTYGESLTFGRNARFREMLREVLLVYSVYDQEVGYVQGMNLIAAILLYHIKAPEPTFWALVQLMENQELRLIYTGSLQHLGRHCRQLDQLMAQTMPELHTHMGNMGVNSRCFLDGWLLSLMSKVVPLQEMHLVVQAFRNKGWPFLYQLVIQLLKALSNCLLLTEDEPEFLMSLSDENCRQLGIEWATIVEQALKAK